MRFQELSQEFTTYFNTKHFPEKPESLYGAAHYMLEDGGKRIRPFFVCWAMNYSDPSNQTPGKWLSRLSFSIISR